MLDQHEWVICPRCDRKFRKGAEESWEDGYCLHCHSPLVRTNNMMFTQANPLHGQPHGWIQWKGTNVCMDINLPCCNGGHIDGNFAYFLKCLCGKYWQVDGHIRLLELTPEEGATVNPGATYILEPDEWDDNDC